VQQGAEIQHKTLTKIPLTVFVGVAMKGDTTLLGPGKPSDTGLVSEDPLDGVLRL
jgi:hypothetical protein